MGDVCCQVRMNTLETYQSDAMERPLLRERLFWALVVSVLLHIGIIYWFHQTQFAHFNAPVERLVPRVFNIRTITVDKKLLEGEDKQAATRKPEDAKPELKTLKLPDEKPSRRSRKDR